MKSAKGQSNKKKDFMKKFCFTSVSIIFLTLIFGCKKSKKNQLIFGVYVEKTLRIDTLDFDIQNRIDSDEPTVDFLSKPYNDTVQNPIFPVNHASMYHYNLIGDSLQLRSFFSSSTWFQHYKISFSADKQQFTVGKFYNRRALPANIEFVRIR